MGARAFPLGGLGPWKPQHLPTPGPAPPSGSPYPRDPRLPERNNLQPPGGGDVPRPSNPTGHDMAFPKHHPTSRAGPTSGEVNPVYTRPTNSCGPTAETQPKGGDNASLPSPTDHLVVKLHPGIASQATLPSWEEKAVVTRPSTTPRRTNPTSPTSHPGPGRTTHGTGPSDRPEPTPHRDSPAGSPVPDPHSETMDIGHPRSSDTRPSSPTSAAGEPAPASPEEEIYSTVKALEEPTPPRQGVEFSLPCNLGLPSCMLTTSPRIQSKDPIPLSARLTGQEDGLDARQDMPQGIFHPKEDPPPGEGRHSRSRRDSGGRPSYSALFINSRWQPTLLGE